MPFLVEGSRKRVAEINRERSGAYRRAVIELHLVRLRGRPDLPLFLKSDNRIDERGMRPWGSRATRLLCGNDVGSCFFQNAEPFYF